HFESWCGNRTAEEPIRMSIETYRPMHSMRRPDREDERDCAVLRPEGSHRPSGAPESFWAGFPGFHPPCRRIPPWAILGLSLRDAGTGSLVERGYGGWGWEGRFWDAGHGCLGDGPIRDGGEIQAYGSSCG